MAEKMNKPFLIAVVGPTASGKSAAAVEIAKRYNGEVVSCDSMQIYRGVPVGTAQPTAMEMQGIPHHLIGIKDLDETFSAAEYAALAHFAIADITARGKLPVLCGGTGLYVKAITSGMAFSDMEKDDNVRLELEKIYAEFGKEKLLSLIKELDPEEALIIDKDNPVRLIRALEVCRLTGSTMTAYKKKNIELPSLYNTLKIGIDYKNRKELYNRINLRVGVMCEMGLLEEAKRVLSMENVQTALQAIGYKELAGYFKGEMGLNTALDNVRQSSRHYAKRQLTWFKRDSSINWFYKAENMDEYAYDACIFGSIDRFLSEIEN